MKIVATLACRNNSSRLYGKPLQYLHRHTCLDYMVERLQERPEIHDIVLAISENVGNEAFVAYAKEKGLKYVTGDDKDVLHRLIKACEAGGGDTVYRTTTESPFTYLEALPEGIEAHKASGAAMTFHGQMPDGSMFELIDLEALKISHREGESRHRSEMCTLFIRENPDRFLIKELPVPEKYRRPDLRLTIDYPEDLIMCRKIVQHFGTDDRYYPYEELMQFLEDHPEVTAIVEELTGEHF